MTVKRSPFSKSTVNKVVKEKFIYGDVLDGPSPKTRLSQFDKLSIELKDKIRKTVSRYIHCKQTAGFVYFKVEMMNE